MVDQHKKIACRVVTPTGRVAFDDGYLLIIKGKQGSEGFMHGHLPTISEVLPSALRYQLSEIPAEFKERYAAEENLDAEFCKKAHQFYTQLSTANLKTPDNSAELAEEARLEPGASGLSENAETLIRDMAAQDIYPGPEGHFQRVIFVSVGYVEVLASRIKVIVNAAEFFHELDYQRAYRALQRAEIRLAKENPSEIDIIHGEHAKRRAEARMRFYKKYAVYHQ